MVCVICRGDVRGGEGVGERHDTGWPADGVRVHARGRCAVLLPQLHRLPSLHSLHYSLHSQ